MTTSKHLGVPDLYAQVFYDFCREFPEHTMLISRFLKDLDKRIQNRGLERTLCIDLPKIGKAFDKGLSTGCYKPNRLVPINQKHITFVGNSDCGVAPILELCFRWSCGGWILRNPIDPTIIFYCRTFLYMAKKLELPAPESVVEQCEAEFFGLDREVAHEWYLEDHLAGELLDEETLSNLLLSVARRVIPLEYPEWKYLNPKHGPGAVADLSYRRKDKFSFPTWSEDLDEWFPYRDFAFHKYMDRESPGGRPIAKICSVPKTLDKVRVITVEPASNQFFQQALRGFLVGRMTAVASRCIDFSSQEKSKAAAKEASIDGSGATVDLKSASDYLSLALVDHIFSVNPPLRDMLLSCRSWGVGSQESYQLLNKYAGQGNATTFAVQSLVYTILAIVAEIVGTYGHRAHVTTGMVKECSRNVRVFGDDIIMSSQNVLYFFYILRLVGLKPNMEKTHYHGFFREACGGDYFRGYDVTPFYIKDFVRRSAPEGLVSWCAVANNAYDKGLLQTSHWMQDGLNLPVNSPSGLGFSSRLPFRFSPKRVRWNEGLQRFEFLELVSSSRPRLRDSELTFGRLYKWFVEQPSSLVRWEGRLTKSTTVSLRKQWVA